MNISELQRLTRWVDRYVVTPNIPNLYQQLLSILNNNAQPNQAKQPFEKQKEALTKTLKAVSLLSLTNEQIALLRKLKLLDHLGQIGVSNLDGILYKNALDIATAVNKVTQIISDVNAAVAKFNQIKEGLSGCIDETTEPLNDEALIRVTFVGDASITEVVQLRDWSDKWYDIARGITMLHDSAPEAIRVVGAARGSFILELTAAFIVVKTISAIIVEVLKVTERYLATLKMAEEIRGLRIANDQIASDLVKAADTERTAAVEKIATSILQQLGIKLGPKRDGDKETAFRNSVRVLIDFYTKGGNVDIIPPEPLSTTQQKEPGAETNIADLNALSENIKEIHKLDRKIKQLEHKPATDVEN